MWSAAAVTRSIRENTCAETDAGAFTLRVASAFCVVAASERPWPDSDPQAVTKTMGSVMCILEMWGLSDDVIALYSLPADAVVAVCRSYLQHPAIVITCLHLAMLMPGPQLTPTQILHVATTLCSRLASRHLTSAVPRPATVKMPPVADLWIAGALLAAAGVAPKA